MPTFKKKRVEVVDARKFTGGVQNGTDLAFWVNSHAGRAEWCDRRGVFPEAIKVYVSQYSWHTVYTGDWVMRNQDGSFKGVRPQELETEYEQV